MPDLPLQIVHLRFLMDQLPDASQMVLDLIEFDLIT
jgi:hypothetical protein